jgi:hypothetical protein
MPDIIFIFLIKNIVCDLAETASPKHQAFFEVKTDAFEEKRVLQPAVVFEMCVAAERAVQVLHAEREGGGKGVDVAGGDVGAGEGGGGAGVVCVGGGEVLGEVGQDGCEAVIFVEAGEGP